MSAVFGLFKNYLSPNTSGKQPRGAIADGLQTEGSPSYPQAERDGRDSVQESLSGMSITERADAETWESVSRESIPRESISRDRRSARTNSTTHRPRDDSARRWKEKFNQTERTLADSRHQLGITQKESDAKERRLDKITTECTGLRADMKDKDNKLSHAKSRLREAQKETETAKGQMLRKGIECDSLRAEREGNLVLMKDQQRRMEKAITERNDLRATVLAKDSTLAHVQTQLAQWKRKTQEATAQAHEDAVSFRKMTQDREGEAKVLRAEIASVRAELGSALKLLDDRTRELKGAQPFLTKTDSLSGAEAMGLVQALNADIFQLAAFMSDSFQPATIETPADEDPKGAHHRIKRHLGDQLVVSLNTLSHTDDPTILQMALQCYLVRVSQDITSDWTFDGTLVLAELYEQVRNSEDQAVAGRWRALSRSHLRHLSAGGKDVLPHIRNFVCAGLADVLISAKCQLSPPGVVEALTGRFRDNIYAIIDAALNINRILGEEITSGDFEIVTCQAGATFDPGSMEDTASDDPSYGKKSIVLCTTEMGLIKEWREVKGGQRAKETTVLLKPKVALESVLAQISSAGETRAALG
ncbi:hypothetical protein FIBSPDRAFT_1045132 [Athelia psychrophila]|uniref:Uncharacterized protein n=1 Tax=Athelia psychrophila TaxID=1759441 RepID=A0A166IQD0_9AGAM|nr:hypothetical protein FIBSPDRAFT_1045132 [Fibularhizoctonia sp. CBS 109695]